MSNKTIKYIEICDYFKKKIEDSEIKAGEKLPTEYEIVNMFSVSRHTVRQAIAELEREGYIYREKARGAFCSNINKKEFKEEKLIMVITTYISDYIFPYIIRGIEKKLSKEGYSVLLFSTNNKKLKEAEHLKKLLNYNVVGAIIEPTASAKKNVNEELYNEINKKNIPYVMINAMYEELNKSFVIMNDEQGGYLLTKHLIDLGHTKIAGIFKEDDLQGINRKKGYFRALEEAGIEIDSTIIGNFKTTEESFYPYAFAKNLLDMEERATAIVCYNDKIAVQVIQATRFQGLKIPEDISIVGYDNDTTIATAVEGGLTTIKHPKEKLGELAAEALVSLIDKKENEVKYVYEPELIIKGSTFKK